MCAVDAEVGTEGEEKTRIGAESVDGRSDVGNKTDSQHYYHPSFEFAYQPMDEEGAGRYHNGSRMNHSGTLMGCPWNVVAQGASCRQ